MILHIYANFNRKGGFYSSIITENIEPDVLVKDYVQIVCNYPKEVLNQLKECDLYYLGTFDNVSGAIVPANDFLLHIEEVVNKLTIEEKKNGRKENK